MRIAILLVTLLAILPTASNSAEPGTCRAPSADEVLADEPYPAHTLSPNEALNLFDVVFHAEVLVPSRPCSLGFCAGLRVLNRVKGDPGSGNVLIQSLKAVDKDAAPCGPAVFNRKGDRWVVFANRGTSKSGLSFLHSEDEGPSYRATKRPNFAALEASHRMLRSRLDQAIVERLGKRRTPYR